MGASVLSFFVRVWLTGFPAAIVVVAIAVLAPGSVAPAHGTLMYVHPIPDSHSGNVGVSATQIAARLSAYGVSV